MPDDLIRFEDLALAAVHIYDGLRIEVEAPSKPEGLATFLVERSHRTERILQDYVTGDLSVDPRRFYDSLGIAKRLVHRAREAGR